MNKDDVFALVITLMLTAGIIAFGILMFNVIYNSDLPTWLKWFLLRG